MATITKENIGLLHEKLNVTIAKEDYLPSFEKALKDYSKKANIPGFRKGQVPAGLIKKMYGTSVFTDEILRTVDRELVKFLEGSKLEIFAQPLPVEMDMRNLNMNNPEDYTFSFEVGMKPEFKLPDLSKGKFTRYKVIVTDEMQTNEIARLQNRYGTIKDLDTVASEENVLNVTFSETDENSNEKEGGIRKDNSLLVKYFSEGFRKELIGKHLNDYVVLQLNTAFDAKEREWLLEDLGLNKTESTDDTTPGEKHFKMVITKIGLLEKKELTEEFFNQLYPGKEIKTESDLRNTITAEIEAHWNAQARNQIHDQVYHELVDHSEIEFPESFLKKWMRTQGEKIKSDEDVEKEFPIFLNQLKWTLITDKIIHENKIEVKKEELRDFAKQQLLGYMGAQGLNDPSAGPEEDWVKNYIDKMMSDRKYIEDAFQRIQTQKLFEWSEQQVNAEEIEITAEDFAKMQKEHHHH